MIPKKIAGTIGLRRQGVTTNYIPKFQVATMSLKVAARRFSISVLLGIEIPNKALQTVNKFITINIIFVQKALN